MVLYEQYLFDVYLVDNYLKRKTNCSQLVVTLVNFAFPCRAQCMIGWLNISCETESCDLGREDYDLD